MHNPKKHPLEIFRARGGHGPLVGRATDGESAPNVGDAPESPGDRLPHGRWEPKAFELRISAFGAVMLAFVWIVLLAGAYTLGVSRGADGSQRDSDVLALERGKQIEAGVRDDGVSSAAPASNGQPFGVLIISYSKDEAKPAKIAELKAILEKNYGIPANSVKAWQLPGGDVAVYVGSYPDRNAPELAQLELKLRNIADWPYGKKSPFETADIRQFPKPKSGIANPPAGDAGGKAPDKN
jgi:hypothetical protein